MTVNLKALRGAYVTLTGIANDHSSAATEARDAARRHELKARDYADMAQAASEAFVALGGDPKEATNWYSWTYLGTNKWRTTPLAYFARRGQLPWC